MTELLCCRRRRVTVSAAPAAVATGIAGLVSESNARRMEALEVRLGWHLPLPMRRHAARSRSVYRYLKSVGCRHLNWLRPATTKWRGTTELLFQLHGRSKRWASCVQRWRTSSDRPSRAPSSPATCASCTCCTGSTSSPVAKSRCGGRTVARVIMQSMRAAAIAGPGIMCIMRSIHSWQATRCSRPSVAVDSRVWLLSTTSLARLCRSLLSSLPLTA